MDKRCENCGSYKDLSYLGYLNGWCLGVPNCPVDKDHHCYAWRIIEVKK